MKFGLLSRDMTYGNSAIHWSVDNYHCDVAYKIVGGMGVRKHLPA